jgi:hypothetical protein
MLLSSYESGPASPMTDYDEPDHHSRLISHHDNSSKTTTTTNNEHSCCNSLATVCNINNNNNNNINKYTRDCHKHRSKLQDRRDQNSESETDEGTVDEVNPATVELRSLRWVSTLGVGGFGRVELVTAGTNNNTAFALKKMKKIEVSFLQLGFNSFYKLFACKF